MSRKIDPSEAVATYFEGFFSKHGAQPTGVDYSTKDRQELCFEQLCKVLSGSEKCFSVIDYGCGYGAMASWLRERWGDDFTYTGYDLVESMISHARRHNNSERTEYVSSVEDLLPVDYVIASGIFNVRSEVSDEEWKQHVMKTLDHMWGFAVKGMSFNILTSYCDKEKMRPHLFYADPCFWFDYCKKRFSRNVALLHDYEAYEFTIVVRKG